MSINLRPCSYNIFGFTCRATTCWTVLINLDSRVGLATTCSTYECCKDHSKIPGGIHRAYSLNFPNSTFCKPLLYITYFILTYKFLWNGMTFLHNARVVSRIHYQHWNIINLIEQPLTGDLSKTIQKYSFSDKHTHHLSQPLMHQLVEWEYYFFCDKN